MQTFFDRWSQLDLQKRKTLRREITTQCRVEVATFYTWLQKKNIPSPQNRTTIARIMGVPELDLFPDTAIINHLN